MDSLFGAEGSLIVRFVVAFVIVLALIGLTFWLVRRFGGARVGQAAQRGRQPRLAVTDAAPVDGRRRLVLVRRDNVEHLIMIGGPSDLVVEQNILRAVPVNAPRDVPVPRAEGARETSRVRQPLDDDTSWPAPQPEPREPRPAFARPEPLARAPRPSFPEPSVRAPLPAGLAPTPRAYEPAPPSIAPSAEPNGEPAQDAALANMAQRLEAALRRPGAPGDRAAPQGGVTPDLAPAESTPTAPDAPAPPRPSGTRKDAQGKTVLDSLEEEMASLLGRPPEKT